MPSPGHGAASPAVHVSAPPSAGQAMAIGMLGGALGGLGYVLALAGAAAWQDRPPVVAANALGAAVVRWLQTAAPQALENFYWDATLIGVGLAVVFGAGVGAVFGGAIERLPEDHPVAWGVVLGLATWAVVVWGIAPALDPVVGQAFAARLLLPAHLVFGVILGNWVHAARQSPLAATDIPETA